MDEDYNMDGQRGTLSRTASFNNVFDQRNNNDNVFKIDVDECEDVCMDEPQTQLQSQQQPTAQQRTLTVSTDVNPASNRDPSPVPTEPEDPDPEYISDQLEKHNIKVLDYGLYPPYTFSSSPISPLTADATDTQPVSPVSPTQIPTPKPSITTAITNITTTSSPPTTTTTSSPPTTTTTSSPPTTTTTNNNYPNLNVPLPPETFDPHKALGEFEYRLRQNPRTLPIPGKTTRRLLELGWISESEVSRRCSAEDLQSLAEFDERNRVRGVRLGLGLLGRDDVIGSGEGFEEDGEGDVDVDVGGWGFNKDGSYPYLTLRYTHIPTHAERDELVNSVRPLFLTVDRVVRMAMAMERERERDRLEAEEALRKARELHQQQQQQQQQQQKEEEEQRERERIERELAEEAHKEAEREESARTNVGAWTTATAVTTDPTTILSPGSIKIPPRTRKRPPHQAWPGDDDATTDEDIDEDVSNEAKRLRLARSQSETWYEQERRLQQQQQQQQQESTSAPSDNTDTPSQQPLSQPQLKPGPPKHTHSRSQSQPTNLPFQPPIKQYPAPLSAYDPHLYPDAASVIESQSQSQSQSQHGGGIPTTAREDTPPFPESQDPTDGRWAVGKGIGIAVGEDGEEIEDTRPNALKRSPKKGLKRGLTRGRTLVQIC